MLNVSIRHIYPNQLGAIVYHGPSRQRINSYFKNTDVVLTTYDALRNDWMNKGPLSSRKWCRVVLDEGL